MIRVLNVSKKYDKKSYILQNINMSIDEKDFVFLIGSSGSGKSTLIKMLTKQEDFSEGEIVVMGSNLQKIKKLRKAQQYRRNIGVVFQDYQLIQHKTVYENLKFVLEYLGYRRKRIKGRINEIAEWIDIKHLLSKKVYTLSGGEQQRVAIARSMINKPALILADEPTGNLDEENAKLIVDIFAKINDLGTTVILATHDLRLIRQIEQKKIYKVENKNIIECTHEF